MQGEEAPRAHQEETEPGNPLRRFLQRLGLKGKIEELGKLPPPE